MDLLHFPNRDGRTHGPFEKGVDHAESRRESRRTRIIARMFDADRAARGDPARHVSATR